MSEIILSHLLITGKLDVANDANKVSVKNEANKVSGVSNCDDTTPKVVIDELLKYYNLESYSDFLKLKFVKVNSIPSDDDLKYIARFINPNVLWDKCKLLPAWEFTKLMMKSRIQVKFNLDQIGLQTPEYPYSLNNCMLYKICREWNLPIDKESTTTDMVNYIKLSIIISNGYKQEGEEVYNNLKLIRSLICTKIHGTEVFNIENIEEKLKNYGEIFKELSFSKRNKFGKSELMLSPTNNIEAIAKIALDHHYDITFSKCPIIDYYYYLTYKNFADDNLLLIKKRSSEQMNLNYNFNPIFPHSFYDKKRMRALLKKKGYTGIINTNDIFGMLEIDHLTDNFHLGWKFKKKNNDKYTVVEKIDIDEILCDDLVAYGNGFSGYSFFTYQELAMLYDNYKTFVVPDNVGEMLQDAAIQRLIILSRNDSKLSQSIAIVSVHSAKSNKKINTLIIWFESLTKENKQNVERILEMLLHAGMYMRGWKGGEDSFPYKKRLIGTEEETLKLEDNINLYLEKLTDEYETDIGKKILDLDLYLFSYNTWKKSEDKAEGFTIKERLNMVGRGETQRKMTSCYKMSSNWICSSSYRYKVLFGLGEPFNIYQMKQISE